MKKLITYSLLSALLFISLFASSAGSRAQNRTPKKRALLVGINRYEQYPVVKNTSGAEEDALETAALIKAQYGFADGDIHFLLGPKATAQALRMALRQIPRRRRAIALQRLHRLNPCWSHANANRYKSEYASRRLPGQALAGRKRKQSG